MRRGIKEEIQKDVKRKGKVTERYRYALKKDEKQELRAK